MSRAYGWIKDEPDPRDVVLPSTHLPPVFTPIAFTLREHMPPVYDQGELGSCTANAIGAGVQYEQVKQKLPEGANVPSRLFIYWNERYMEGNVDYDSGAQIRDGMKVVGQQGAPPESDWPYVPEKFKTKPPVKAYSDALLYEAKYGRVVQTVTSLQGSIYRSRPVVFGFTVYESFESDEVAETGVVPMPKANEEIVGGHAVLAMGWKQINDQLYFEVRNSWGPDWGDHGYFWMPAAYLTNPSLASDFWHINFET
jgi:C1A family cysteine protease